MSPAAQSSLSLGFDLPFVEQAEFLRQKLNLPTQRWDDIMGAAHDRSFVVAGAMKADLLADLHNAVNKAVGGRVSLETFRKDFREIVTKRGWHGWTGEGTEAGEAWRARIIYETNLATSYAAGRYAQLTDPDLLSRRPYWKYVHDDSVDHPRPEHVAWDGLVLRHDHPFWQTHYPPNGWGCRCRVTAVTGPKEGDKTTPPEGWNDINDKTGAPPGIDKGWNYAPGANTNARFREIVQDKLIKYPEAISQALSRDIGKQIDAHTDVVAFARKALTDMQYKEELWLGFAPADISEQAGTDVSKYLVLVSADSVRHIDKEHGNDKGEQKPVTAEGYATVSKWLHEGMVTRSEQTGDNGKVRLKAIYKNNGEAIHSIWEVRHGQRNLAISLVSTWIKIRRK